MRTPKNCEDRLLNKSPTRILKSQMTHRQIKQTRKITVRATSKPDNFFVWLPCSFFSSRATLVLFHFSHIFISDDSQISLYHHTFSQAPEMHCHCLQESLITVRKWKQHNRYWEYRGMGSTNILTKQTLYYHLSSKGGRGGKKEETKVFLVSLFVNTIVISLTSQDHNL